MSFDDIRPFTEAEIPAAMQRIASSDYLPLIAAYVYPGEPIDVVRRRIASYTSVADFQSETMHRVNERIIENTVTEFSYHGLEALDKEQSYLYISNHRDIMLDASFLQNALFDNGFDTTEITFGANLMMNDTVTDIGRANKMFRVERPGSNIKEFYRRSQHLSDYIRYAIREKRQSVWIAQRNGRTKDGDDRTDQGVIKMLCMSRSDDKIAALDDLHIVPMAVSYEWETCDILKTLELYETQQRPYIKKPGEDLNSILTGITQQKGRVHIEICAPITRNELDSMASLTSYSYHKAVARLIDSRIRAAYHLYPNNYIAHDLRYATTRYRDRYSDAQRDAFVARLQQLDAFEKCDGDRLRDIFIGIYSNPVER